MPIKGPLNFFRNALMKNKCKAVVDLRKHGDLRNCPGGRRTEGLLMICVNGYRLKNIVRLFIFYDQN